MNIGAYIIIFGVGAALMIIGFWIGYVYRATHEPDPLTPEERRALPNPWPPKDPDDAPKI